MEETFEVSCRVLILTYVLNHHSSIFKVSFLRFIKQWPPFQRNNDSKNAETKEPTNNVRGMSAASSDSYPSHSIPTDRESIFPQRQSPQSFHASEQLPSIEPSHTIRSRATSFSGESVLNRSSKSRSRVPSRTFSLDAQPSETASKLFGIGSPLGPLQSVDSEDDSDVWTTPSSISSGSSSHLKNNNANSSSNSIRIARSFRQNERSRSEPRGGRLGSTASSRGKTPPPSTASVSGSGAPLNKSSQGTEETLLRVTEALNSNLGSGSRSFPRRHSTTPSEDDPRQLTKARAFRIPDSPPDYGLLSRSPSPELFRPLDK